MRRRWGIGLALSAAGHAAVVGVLVGWALLRDAAPGNVDIDLTGNLEELKDLPLGAPAPGDEGDRPRPRIRASEVTAGEGPRSDDGTTDEGARPSDLRQLGPEGSRFTLLLRLDRLRGTPFADPVDTLLQRMPDRRDLLEGTGLGLYEDFEALLVSTPNPMDYTVTFLAARHRLSDAALRAAVERGVRATNRTIVWRTERRRLWGERRALAASMGVATSRDERIIVMPAPGLVVVTPPTYRSLLLAAPRHPHAPDGGAPDAGAAPDAGGADAGTAAAAPTWTTLLRRIDAEDGLLGPTAIAMATAVDLFKKRGGVPVVFMGTELDVPRLVTVVLGADPEPYVEITGEFREEREARRWEASWPGLQRKVRSNAYVVLGGFSAAVGRATSTRDGSTVKLRVTATVDETVRLLQMAASALARR
jgi:hypothetical protein